MTTTATPALVDAATRLGTAMAAAADILDAETYLITADVAVAIADRDADGNLTAAGMDDVTAALNAKVAEEAAAKPRLSALDMSERAGITFSIIKNGDEFGVTTFSEDSHDRAVEFARKAATASAFGLVPRTPSAVDVMAEVLS